MLPRDAIGKTDNRNTGYLALNQVRKLGAALDELAAEQVNPKALNIARLWALTGCRRNEIAALRWSEVDFERGCLVLGDTKTGLSVRRGDYLNQLGLSMQAITYITEKQPADIQWLTFDDAARIGIEVSKFPAG